MIETCGTRPVRSVHTPFTRKRVYTVCQTRVKQHMRVLGQVSMSRVYGGHEVSNEIEKNFHGHTYFTEYFTG